MILRDLDAPLGFSNIIRKCSMQYIIVHDEVKSLWTSTRVTVFLCLYLYDWQTILFLMKRDDCIQVEN